MEPITKFANTDFDIVEVDGRLFAITSFDRTWANAFECSDTNTRMPEPNEYRLFPKTADGEKMVDFWLSDVDHFTIREVKEHKSFYTHTAADWLFRKGK